MTKLTLSFLIFCTCFVMGAVNGKQRSINMETLVQEPQSSIIYPDKDPIPFVFAVRNLGPDTLLQGDSLFVELPDGSAQVMLMPQDLVPGDSVELLNGTMQVKVEETKKYSICVTILDDPSTQVEIEGQPVSLSYKDPVPGNNKNCKEITIKTDKPTGIADAQSITTSLALYPNPASENVWVPLFQPEAENTHLCLRDIMGRVVLQKTWDKSNTLQLQQVPLNVSSLSEGIYSLSVTAGGLTQTGKLVIRKGA